MSDRIQHAEPRRIGGQARLQVDGSLAAFIENSAIAEDVYDNASTQAARAIAAAVPYGKYSLIKSIEYYAASNEPGNDTCTACNELTPRIRLS